MSSFILLWNPNNSIWTTYQDFCDWTADGESGFLDDWAVGARKSGIDPGDRVYMYRTVEHQGLVASGIVQEPSGESPSGDAIYWGEHWDGETVKETPYVDVSWEKVLPPDETLWRDELERKLPFFKWKHLQGSGIHVPEPGDEDLLRVWDEHVESLGMSEAVPPPEELPPGNYWEGDVRQVLVNRYERNPKARQAAIDAHGTRCTICGFDFEAVYGALGEGFIHIHHTVELSGIGEEYRVDPALDLIPVCPNCHAMLHRTTPAMSPEELRELIENNGPR